MFEFGPAFDISQRRPKVVPMSYGPAGTEKQDQIAGPMTVNDFEKVYGQTEVIADILSYAADIQEGKYLSNSHHAKPSPALERSNLLSYMIRCPVNYILACHPRRFLRHALLVHDVSGTENIEVHVEVS
jgi:hypothetical protein